LAEFLPSANLKHMGERYIFTIRQLTKTYGKKEVLKNIWLAFYSGAKIGVIGSNGAGKSTLLRIMAMQDREFVGEAEPDKGISIGFVPQEPQLSPKKTVLENVVLMTIAGGKIVHEKK
jgi:ATPase subunit of ABC transporter with duplicated ATPase domains